MTNLSTISAAYWHALNLIIPQNLWKLSIISHELGGPEYIWKAPTKVLEVAGLSPRLANQITAGRGNINIEAEWQKLNTQGIHALVLEEIKYPKQLAQIHSAPPIIYVRGKISILQREGLAVVGSRKLSAYGQDAIEHLIPPLASMGVGIISGMAYGADSAALGSCIKHGGVPVAVLAGGLGWNEISPRPHLDLAQQIANVGCLVSENPPGTMINKNHFPLRNRIVSGLSLGVLVIEAASRSGSAITARLGLEQNREVFAVPGSIFSPNSEGTLDLIKRGAKCVTNAADIAQEFGWDLVAAAKSKFLPSNSLHKSIHDTLQQEPLNSDAIIQNLGKPAHLIIAALTELEVAGILRRSGNGVYHNVT